MQADLNYLNTRTKAKNKKLKNMAYVINQVGDSKRSYGYSEGKVKKSWFKK